MRIPESELIINSDQSAFHIHLRPEELADIVILVGDDETTAVVYPIFCFKKEQFEALPEFKDINCTIIQGRLLRAMKGNGQYEGKYILLFDDCRVIEQ